VSQYNDSSNCMKSPAVCRAPDANVSPPDFPIPANACDCHYHIFDGPSKQVLPRTYTAPAARLDELDRLHDTLGISRSVVIQPSIYGTDNRTTLSAIRSIDATKAVVVVDDTASLASLTELKNAGAVGCRVNQLFRSNTKLVNLKSLARKAIELDWHLQLLADVSTFDNLIHTIESLEVPVVFDHMGHMPSHKGVNNPGFKQLLHLLGEGKAWVKLSGAYRLIDDMGDGKPPEYSDVNNIVDALVRTNSDHLIWGSDWPHPHVSQSMPNDTDLLNLLSKWIPNTQLRNRILVQNPENLYGF